eukprot:1056247-Prorocentrum_minimum.AAC.1
MCIRDRPSPTLPYPTLPYPTVHSPSKGVSSSRRAVQDAYPAGNERMEAPRRGDGADFNPNSEYRMYHGDKVPGFPQHPHRGFETITATITGRAPHGR